MCFFLLFGHFQFFIAIFALFTLHLVDFNGGRIDQNTLKCLESAGQATAQRLNKSFHPCRRPITFFLLGVYTSIRPSVCLSLSVCRRVCVFASVSQRLCAVYVVCCQRGRHAFTPRERRGFRPEVCCRIDLIAAVYLQSRVSRNSQALADETKLISLYAGSQTRCTQSRRVSAAESKLWYKQGAEIAVVHTLKPCRCIVCPPECFYCFICAIVPTAITALFAFSNFTEKTVWSFFGGGFGCNSFSSHRGCFHCCTGWINCSCCLVLISSNDTICLKALNKSRAYLCVCH